MKSENEVRAALYRLRRLDRRCREARRRFGSHRYLAEVYGLYAQWRAQRMATCHARLILELEGASPQLGTHALQVMIDATSKASAKMKSRWTLALRFIWRCRHRWTDFFAFVHFHGGIAGCAEQMAMRWPRRNYRDRRYYLEVSRKRLLALDRARGRFRSEPCDN